MARASGVRSTSFADAAGWIDQADLTEVEIDLVAKDLENHILSDDGRFWVEWLGKHASPERAREDASRISEGWVRTDYKAVGKWLESAPASPAKEGPLCPHASSDSNSFFSTSAKRL